MTQKEIRTQALATIQIGERNYTEAKTRVEHVAKNFDYEVKTKHKFYPEIRLWVVKATVTIYEEGKPYKYQGTAKEYENKLQGDVNSTSALENAETSAIGRALAFAGIGSNSAIASADEIKAAERAGGKIKGGNTTKAKEAQETSQEGPTGNNFDKVNFLVNQINTCETVERLTKMLENYAERGGDYTEDDKKILDAAFTKRKEALRKRVQRAAAAAEKKK